MAPIRQAGITLLGLQFQGRVATGVDHCFEIPNQALAILVVAQGAVFKQTIQQETIHEADLIGVHAQRQVRIDVDTAHFDIFHTAFAQGTQGNFAGFRDALGANRAVELVFNL